MQNKAHIGAEYGIMDGRSDVQEKSLHLHAVHDQIHVVRQTWWLLSICEEAIVSVHTTTNSIDALIFDTVPVITLWSVV